MVAMDLTEDLTAARTAEDTKLLTVADTVDIVQLLTHLVPHMVSRTVVPERFPAEPTCWSDAPHRWLRSHAYRPRPEATEDMVPVDTTDLCRPKKATTATAQPRRCKPKCVLEIVFFLDTSKVFDMKFNLIILYHTFSIFLIHRVY